MLMMSEVCETLHTVVLTPPGYAVEQLNDHTWLYPTNTYIPFMHYFDAKYVVQRQVSFNTQLYADVIISDDPFIPGWVGLHIAQEYDRAWVVYARDFYWQHSIFSRLFRVPMVPLKAVLEGATRVCAFSQRAFIYLDHAANAIEKGKLRALPEIYTQPQHALEPKDLKVLYPEYNFVLLAAVPDHLGGLDTLVGTLALLRVKYAKAGLVLFSPHNKERQVRRVARAYRLGDWVRFVKIEPNSFPFQGANVFLYLNASPEDDTTCIRAAAASCPIVAVRSVVSQKVIEDRVNGLFVADAQPQTLHDAIRVLNETPGWRERFQVNAGMHLSTIVVPPHEQIVELLRAALTFPYELRPPVPPKPDPILVPTPAPGPTLVERVRAFFK